MQKFSNAFGYNAAFSLISGVVIMMEASYIAAHLIAAPEWFFTGLGLVLIGFAGMIAFAVLKDIPHGLSMFITLQDGLWVVATTAALAIFWQTITPLGATLIMAINLMVAGFGLAQLRLLRAREQAAD